MKINFLDLLSIHENDIEVTEKRISETFKGLNLCEPDDLAERTMQYLCEQEITEDLGNQIIACMLEAAQGALLETVAPFEPKIETFCNGADSRFSLLYESDKNIIKAWKSNPNLDIEFVEWLANELADDCDLEEVVKNDTLCDALYELRDEGGHLVIDDVAEYSNEEIEAKEQECLANPSDASKIFFMGVSGNLWISDL